MENVQRLFSGSAEQAPVSLASAKPLPAPPGYKKPSVPPKIKVPKVVKPVLNKPGQGIVKTHSLVIKGQSRGKGAQSHRANPTTSKRRGTIGKHTPKRTEQIKPRLKRNAGRRTNRGRNSKQSSKGANRKGGKNSKPNRRTRSQAKVKSTAVVDAQVTDVLNDLKLSMAQIDTKIAAKKLSIEF